MRLILRLGGLILLIGFNVIYPSADQPRKELDVHYGPGPMQVLDLFLPEGAGFSTIVYTYGGGWHSGSGKSSDVDRGGAGTSRATHARSCRIAFFRPITFPAPAEDLAAAFAWVKSNVRFPWRRSE